MTKKQPITASPITPHRTDSAYAFTTHSYAGPRHVQPHMP